MILNRFRLILASAAIVAGGAPGALAGDAFKDAFQEEPTSEYLQSDSFSSRFDQALKDGKIDAVRAALDHVPLAQLHVEKFVYNCINGLLPQDANHLEIARLLLDRGVSRDEGPYGEPLIVTAVLYKRPEYVRLLVEHHAKLDQKDVFDHLTALERAQRDLAADKALIHSPETRAELTEQEKKRKIETARATLPTTQEIIDILEHPERLTGPADLKRHIAFDEKVLASRETPAALLTIAAKQKVKLEQQLAALQSPTGVERLAVVPLQQQTIKGPTNGVPTLESDEAAEMLFAMSVRVIPAVTTETPNH